MTRIGPTPKKPNSIDKLLAIVLAGLLLITVMWAFAVLLTIPVLIGWNLGVIGVAKALHLHAPSTLGFWAALGVSFALASLGRVFHETSTAPKNDSG